MDDQQFWMVWNPNDRAPRFKHANSCLAVQEAERLATLNPGQQFFVLKATHMRVTDNMHRVELKRPKELLPTPNDVSPF